MKVLYILDSYLNYHIDVFAVLARELRSYDVIAYVISRREKENENFYIVKQPSISELNNLKKIVEKENIDIIHSFSFGYSGLISKYLSNMTKRKLFYTFIRDPFTGNSLVNNLIKKYLDFLLRDAILVLPKKIRAFPIKPHYILPIGLDVSNPVKDADLNRIIAFDIYNYKFLNRGSNIRTLIDQAPTISNLSRDFKITIYSSDPKSYSSTYKNLTIEPLSIKFRAGIYYHGYTDQFIDLFMIKNILRGGKVVLNSKSPLADMFDEHSIFNDSKELPMKIKDIRDLDVNYSEIVEQYNIKKLAPLYKYAYSNI
ncbi:MAG: hypothetical protein N3C61_02245 [Candidatus Micrarchaeota archaeon]|nr:hypothetical protein [Candidatus Micrarchaeota archaeon]